MRDIIFVATTGRSGTNWLHKQLNNNFPTITVCHEEFPALDFKEYKEGNWKSKRVKILKKLEEQKLYIETNHMFIKTFYKDAVKEFRDRLKVIILEREPELVARSMFSLNTIPGENYLGNKWYGDPDDKENLVKCPSNNKFVRCLWTCYEVKARTNKFTKDYSDIPVFRTTLNELQEESKFLELLEWVTEGKKSLRQENLVLNTTPNNGSQFINLDSALLSQIIKEKELFEK